MLWWKCGQVQFERCFWWGDLRPEYCTYLNGRISRPHIYSLPSITFFHIVIL